MLPAARSVPRRADARGLAAHRAHEGPGGRSSRERHSGRVREQQPASIGDRQHPYRSAHGAHQNTLCRARAPDGARLRVVPRLRVGQSHRDRRGALHLRVGTRLPARLPKPQGPPRALSRCALHRPHGDGHRAGSGRHRHSARDPRRQDVPFQLQSQEPDLHRAAEERPVRRAAQAAQQTQGRVGDHLLLLA